MQNMLTMQTNSAMHSHSCLLKKGIAFNLNSRGGGGGGQGLCLSHTVQKDSRGVLGMSFRFEQTSEILENIQYGGSSVVKTDSQGGGAFYRQRSMILRYCWPTLHLLWLLKSSWSCIVSNPFINVLSICLFPQAGITEENNTVQRDILNYGNICWHVHHL